MKRTSMRTLEEAIAWEIFRRGETLRSELGSRFDVSPATISRAVDVLLDRHIIQETSATISARGRKPGLLRIRPELAYLLGLEIDRDHITAVVTDITGVSLGRASLGCDPRRSLGKALVLCRRLVRAALADAGLPLSKISRIGVGHTGILDYENGICLSWAGAKEWGGLRLRRVFQEMFSIEVTVDDRARALALAEHWGSPKNSKHLNAVYVQIGTGVGAGLFVDGRLVRGVHLAGGEMGHAVIERDGPVCGCGNRGCLEAYASSEAVVRSVQAELASGRRSDVTRITRGNQNALTIDAVASAAKYGDELCREALCQAGEALGIGVANTAQLLNPSLVVLSGRLAWLAGPYLLDAVCRVVHRQCFENISKGLEIRLGIYRKDFAAIGCAKLAAEEEATGVFRRIFVDTGRTDH